MLKITNITLSLENNPEIITREFAFYYGIYFCLYLKRQFP